MHYSSFEVNGRVRRAGNIEKASGRELMNNFSRMSNIETPRCESVHDDLFEFSSGRNSDLKYVNINRLSTSKSRNVYTPNLKRNNELSDDNLDDDIIDLNQQYDKIIRPNKTNSQNDDEEDDDESMPPPGYIDDDDIMKSLRNYRPKNRLLKSASNVNNYQNQHSRYLNNFNTKNDQRESMFFAQSVNASSAKRRSIEVGETDNNQLPNIDIHPKLKNTKETKNNDKSDDNFVIENSKKDKKKAKTENEMKNLKNDEKKKQKEDLNQNKKEKIDNEPEEEEEEEELPPNNFNLEYFRIVKFNIINFIQNSPPKDTLIRSKIKINRGLFNTYTMFLEKEDTTTEIPIMTSKPKKVSAKAFYWIHIYDNTDNELTNKSSEKGKLIKFGKMVANVTKSKYKLIGNLNENDSDDSSDDENNDQSKTYFLLEYNNKVMSKSKPKDLKINLMLNDKDESIRVKSSRSENDDESEKKKNKPKIFNLVTKKPEWDQEAKTFTLDFKCRAFEASTNNLQIIDESNKSNVLLQLGKVNSKCYNLDFTYPFNAFSAFGLAISCLTRN